MAQPAAGVADKPATPSEASQRELILRGLRDLMPTTLVDKIRGSAEQIRGQRREVTVLFVRLTHRPAAQQATDEAFTGPDPETLFWILDQTIRRLVQVVYRYEGTIDKVTGDGIMALFGAPVAHEDDPVRAVHTALEIHEVLSQLSAELAQQHGLHLEAQIGINTGEVIAGKVGHSLHMEYTVIGDTVNLAARLHNAARPGTTLASLATYQRTRRSFHFVALPPMQLKGLPEPVRAFQAVAARERPEQTRGIPGVHVPMVGRQDLLTQLDAMLEQMLRTSRSHYVLVSGEAGLGKSRLVQEFLDRNRHRPLNFHVAACLAYTRATPYYLLGALLRELAQIPEGEPAHVRRERLERYLQEVGLPTAELLPYLAVTLGMEGSSPEIGRRIADLTTEVLQRQIHGAVGQVLRAEVGVAPTVLVLEDIHWLDPASRTFLAEFIETAADLPILFILVSREYERATVVRPLLSVLSERSARFCDLQLSALSAEESLELVQRLLQKVGLARPGLAERIAERAEGNPFYIEEIVRMLAEQAELDQTGSTPELSPDQAFQIELLLGTVPGTLRGLILARFDALSDTARDVIQRAAVLGRSFPVELLQRLTLLDQGTLLRHLDDLVERQFLVHEPFGETHGYAFRHILIQEAIYSTLLRRDRREIHYQVALVLEHEQFLPLDAQVEALAYHYLHSDHPKHARAYLLQAAQRAMQRSAYESAVQFYDQLLVFYEQAPSALDPIYAETLAGMGQALKLSGAYEEALDYLSDVLAYLEGHFAALEKDPALLDLYLEVHRELGDVLQRRGEFEQANTHLDTALALAERHGRLQLPIGYTLIERKAWVEFRLGNLDQSAELAQNAIRQLEKEGAADVSPIVLANLYNTLGGVTWQRGNLYEAVPYVQASLRLYEEAGYAWGMSVAYTNLGNLYWSMNQWPQATEAYNRAAQLQADNGFVAEQTLSLRNLGYLLAAQGQYQEARQAFLQTLTLGEAQENGYSLLLSYLALAALAADQEQRDELAHALAQARKHAEQADLQHRLELDIYTGLLQILDGRYAEAEPLLLDACQQAEQLGLQEIIFLGEYILGRLYAGLSRLSVAEYHLRRSAELAAQRGNRERQAKALEALARIFLEHSRSPGQDPAMLLTKAEHLADAAKTLFQEIHLPLRAQACQVLRDQIRRAQQHWTAREEIPGLTEAPVLPESGWSHSKRFQATVVWLEFRSENTASVDEEWAFEELTTLLSMAHAIAEDQGGQWIRQGDGFLLVFGWPAVQEDDPWQAVEAALRLLEELTTSTRARIYRPAIGISTGQAIAAILDPGHDQRLMVNGPPVDRARDLAAQASPGQIWLDEPTANRVRHAYELASVASETAHPVFRVCSRLARPGRMRGLGKSTRMIGRTQQLQAMLQFTQKAVPDHGGLLWLEGDAGIGKSRLLQEYMAQLQVAHIPYWHGMCTARGMSRPFSLFRDLFAFAFGFHPGDSPAILRQKLDRKLSAWQLQTVGNRAAMELLCGLPLSPESQERLQQMAPEQLRQQVFTAVRAALVAQMAHGPLVLVLDDLHWIDPVSANLLLSLAPLVLSSPVIFALATRPDIEDDGPAEIRTLRERFAAYTLHLELTQLSCEESRTLLHLLLDDAPVDPFLEHFVLTQSQGNPYYVEEFVRFLFERELVRRTPEGWVLAGAPEETRQAWPTNLEALIRSRVETLPPLQRRLVQYAAVLARPFKASLMARLLQRSHLDDVLSSLVRRRVLNHDPANNLWYLDHHLTQMVIYNSLLRAYRQTLHLDVAQVLEETAGDDIASVVEELAHHYQEAGHPTKALDYWIQAGEQAMMRHAVEAALGHFEQAQAILEQEILHVSPLLHWQVAVGLGDAYRILGKLDQAAQVLREALARLGQADLDVARRAGLYRRLGDVVRRQGHPEKAYDAYRQALVLLEEPESTEGKVEAARALLGLAFTHFHRGQLDKARRVAELAREYAQRADSAVDQAAAENLLGGIAYEMGDWQEAMAHVDRALQIQERENDLTGMAASLSNLAILAAESGDRARAHHYFHRSLELRQEIGDVEGVVVTHNNMGRLEQVSGELEAARAHFEQSRTLSQSLQFPYHLATALVGLGELQMMEGNLDEAQQHLDQAVHYAQEVDAQAILAEAYQLQAQVALRRGHWQQAEELSRWSILLAAETGSAALEAGGWRVLSQTQLAQGAVEAAVRSLHMARQRLSDLQGLEAGRLWMQAARVHAAQSQMDEAWQALQRARTLFARLGARYDLEEAERLIEQMRPLALPVPMDAETETR